jgi:hypothetical protein
MLIGLTLEEAVVDTTDLLMVYHSISLMCFEKPTDFAIPNLGLKQTTQSILIPGGSCSLEEKARNIISWYLEENRNTKVVFLCDNIDSSEGEPIYTRSDKLMESEGSKVPLCVLSATRGSAIALIKESARLRDEKLQLKIPAHNGFQLQSKKQVSSCNVRTHGFCPHRNIITHDYSWCSILALGGIFHCRNQ